MFEKIAEFMKDNYEWLFSGIGLAVAGAVAKWLLNKMKKAKNKAKNIIEKSLVQKLMKKEALSPKTMTIFDNNGNSEQVEVIVAFEFKDNKKEYVVYTKNETDKHQNTTVYVSEVDRSSGEPTLMGIDDNDDWNRVLEVLKYLAEADPDAPIQYDEEGIEII